MAFLKSISRKNLFQNMTSELYILIKIISIPVYRHVIYQWKAGAFCFLSYVIVVTESPIHQHFRLKFHQKMCNYLLSIYVMLLTVECYKYINDKNYCVLLCACCPCCVCYFVKTVYVYLF